MAFIKFRNIENNITRRKAKCLMRKKNRKQTLLIYCISIHDSVKRVSKSQRKNIMDRRKRVAEYPLYIWCPYHKLSWKITWWRKIEIWLNEPCLLLPSLVLLPNQPSIPLYTIYGIPGSLLHMYFSLMTFSFDIGSSLTVRKWRSINSDLGKNGSVLLLFFIICLRL